MRKLTLLIALMTLALAHRSDGQQAAPIADQLRLAAVMPRGAMVYVQANDLGALMKTWLASPVRSHFYDSASFTAFQKSHVYLKLQDRKKDFETAIGFGLDEKRLAELAGRASAVSVYDVGKLEIVFVTEIPRARAVASVLFKQAAQFSERSADGTSYYVRDVTTDGGRLNQQFCFAYVEGKLIVTTTEGLMIRAIANAKTSGADSLSADVLGLAEQAVGFSAHDVMMWLDQSRLNRNRYFNNYWIHQNAESGLGNIESGLIDLRITREGMNEQRWFKTGAATLGPGVGAMSGEQIALFMAFAPASAQLIQVRAAVGTERLSAAIEQSLFGKLPDEVWSPPEVPDHTRSTSDENDHSRAQRYSRLDSRFDIDVDDDQAPKRGSTDEQELGKKSPEPQAGSDFAKKLALILTPISTTSYCELVRSRAEAGKPFVRFERAIVAQLKPEAAVGRETLEGAIVDELRARFVVAGTQPRLEWQDEGTVRFVAQSLLEQGVAYAVSRNYLVLASSKEFAKEILQAARAATTPPERADSTIAFYALIRVADAKPAFDTLMSKLDGRDRNKPSRAKKDNEEEGDVKFFSENLSSLIAASAIREVRLTRQPAGPLATERIVYSW